MPTSPELVPGAIVWADLDPAVGREHGRRPVLVIASRSYLEIMDQLAVVVPISSVDRGWPNHVALGGLARPSFAMTEQLRTVSRARLRGPLTFASGDELIEVRRWIAAFTSEAEV